MRGWTEVCKRVFPRAEPSRAKNAVARTGCEQGAVDASEIANRPLVFAYLCAAAGGAVSAILLAGVGPLWLNAAIGAIGGVAAVGIAHLALRVFCSALAPVKQRDEARERLAPLLSAEDARPRQDLESELLALKTKFEQLKEEHGHLALKANQRRDLKWGLESAESEVKQIPSMVKSAFYIIGALPEYQPGPDEIQQAENEKFKQFVDERVRDLLTRNGYPELLPIFQDYPQGVSLQNHVLTTLARFRTEL